MLNIITNGYIPPFISKSNLARFPLIHLGFKAFQKTKLWPLVSSLLWQERNRKGGKCKICRVLQSPVSSPQASPKVEASNRLKQAQHFSTHRKVQNRNSRVHQDLPGSRGLGIIDRSIRCLPSHPQPPKLKEIPKIFPQVFQFSLPFGQATTPQVFTMIVKKVKLMALSRGLGLHQYLDV